MTFCGGETLTKLLHLTVFYRHDRTQGVLHSILCSRLLLGLRGAYEDLTVEVLLSMRVTVQTPIVSNK